MSEHHCVVCGYKRMSYYLTIKDICIWCDYFIPEHIPSEQAKKYLNATILKYHNRKLVYERKSFGGFLKKRHYTRMSDDDVNFLDDLSGVTQGMSMSTGTYAFTSSVQANVTSMPGNAISPANVIMTSAYISTI